MPDDPHRDLAQRAAELHKDLEAAWDAAAPDDGTVTERSRLLYNAAAAARSTVEALRLLLK